MADNTTTSVLPTSTTTTDIIVERGPDGKVKDVDVTKDTTITKAKKNAQASSSDSDVDWQKVMDNVLFGGAILVLIFVVVMLASFLVTTLGTKDNSSFPTQQSDNDKTNNLFFILIFVIIVILVVAGGLRYLFSTSVFTQINDTANGKEVDIIIDHKTNSSIPPPPPNPNPQPCPASTPITGNQVFNIPGQYFNYETAGNLCKAYGARLANYSEVENAYENGAEWCNYGWSDGQMALFPTQKSTWDKLQNIEGHENDCGRPGVNGGFMNNTELQFGANCYGKKPPITSDEQFIMENSPLYPVTNKEIEEQEEVNFLKQHLDQILVNPFNNTRWSRY